MNNFDRLQDEVWDLDTALAKVIHAKLLYYKQVLQVEGLYSSPFTDDDGESWLELIGEMIYAFGEISQSRYSHGPEQGCKECLYTEKQPVLCPRVERGRALFNEYFYYLWL